MNNEKQSSISKEQKIYLSLFNEIKRMEHENKRTKERTSTDMVERIKKLIQTKIVVEEE